MPFNPTPLKTNPVQLALTIREMRMKQKQAERQFQIDKINAIGKAKKEQVETQKAQFELRKMQDEWEDRRDEQEQGISTFFQGANDPDLPLPQRQAFADRAVSELNQSIAGRYVGGEGVDDAATSVGVNAGLPTYEARLAAAQEEAEINRQADKEVSVAERKAESARERKLGLPKAYSDRIREKKRQLAADKKEGYDTSALEQEIEDLELAKQNMLRSGRIDVRQGVSPNIELEVTRDIAKMDRGINLISGLTQDMDSGAIKTGLPGLVEGIKQQAIGIAEDIVNDTEIRADIRSKFQDALMEGGATFEVDGGKQLTLGLDQMMMAYQFVLGQRDSARITLREYSDAIKELGFTGVWKSEKQVRRAMAKVAKSLMLKRNQEAQFLSRHGIEIGSDTANLTPEQRRFLDNVAKVKSGNQSGRGERRTRPDPSKPGGLTAKDLDAMTEEELMNLQ